MKAEEIDILKSGIREELSVYSEILEISRKENGLLMDKAPLKEVFAFIPRKMELIRKAEKTDEGLLSLKEQWSRMKKDELPQELVRLLKEVESILGETILVDEKNRELMGKYPVFKSQEHSEALKENVRFRAIKAYGG